LIFIHGYLMVILETINMAPFRQSSKEKNGKKSQGARKASVYNAYTYQLVTLVAGCVKTYVQGTLASLAPRSDVML